MVVLTNKDSPSPRGPPSEPRASQVTNFGSTPSKAVPSGLVAYKSLIIFSTLFSTLTSLPTLDSSELSPRISIILFSNSYIFAGSGEEFLISSTTVFK
nr:MAG TPA: hypothetical protein [Crassvirales sp.]